LRFLLKYDITLGIGYPVIAWPYNGTFYLTKKQSSNLGSGHRFESSSHEILGEGRRVSAAFVQLAIRECQR
jgi:hypothetical protein